MATWLFFDHWRTVRYCACGGNNMDVLDDRLINPHTGRPFVKGFFRKYAKGKPCLSRIASTCGQHGCASQETTVLAHLTMPGLKGAAMKLPDLLGAWACFTCHGILDGAIRVPLDLQIGRNDIALWHHEGVARTLARLVEDGLLPNP